MEAEKPVNLYFIVTIIIIIAITLIGLAVRNYIAGKLPDKTSEEQPKNATKEYDGPEEERQSKAIAGLAAILFIVLSVIYATYYMTRKYVKSQ